MIRDNVIHRLCLLCAEVAENEFKNEEASDCFCSVNITRPVSFHFSEKVLEHIEKCVRKK
jgi:hypothetical protein